MLCADCHIRPTLPRRTRCLECMAGKMPAAAKRPPYNPEDHAGKRAALKALIESSKKPW